MVELILATRNPGKYDASLDSQKKGKKRSKKKKKKEIKKKVQNGKEQVRKRN